MNFVNALKWSFLAELSAKLVQPVVFLVLAFFLTPQDFGVMTAAMMVIAFSQIFWEAGMGKALVQRQTDIGPAANAAFWVNLILAIIISGLLLKFASSIALLFFQDDRVTIVLQVMTLQVILGALGSVQTALLQKNMGFKALFWVRFATSVLPGAASVPLAWYGFGYWALVVGMLVGQVVQIFLLWQVSNWRPSFELSIVVTKEMMRFGSWVAITGFLTWFYMWADSLVIGSYLGSSELGVFRMGSQIPNMIFVMLFGPIAPVIYSRLVQITGVYQDLSSAADAVLKILVFLSIPMAMVLFIYSAQIENVFFEGKWRGVGSVIGWMALMYGYSWIVGLNGEFYRALGRPSYETIVAAGLLFIYLPVYIFAVKDGLEGFVIARTFLSLLALVLHIYLLSRILNIKIVFFVRSLIFVSFVSWLFIAAGEKLIIKFTDIQLLQILIGGGGGGICVFLLIFLLEGKEGFRALRRITARK